MNAALDKLALVASGTAMERAKLRGAMERLLDCVGFSGTMREVDKAKHEFLAAHRSEAEEEGWVG